MHSKLSLASALGLGSALVWSLVSCGPTCPGVASCDTENSSTAGAAGADAGTCEQVEALEACLNSFCASNGKGTLFCNCHDKGFDLSGAPNCGCIKFNAKAFCQQAEFYGYTAAYFSDCAARTSPLLTMCVPVQ